MSPPPPPPPPNLSSRIFWHEVLAIGPGLQRRGHAKWVGGGGRWVCISAMGVHIIWHPQYTWLPYMIMEQVDPSLKTYMYYRKQCGNIGIWHLQFLWRAHRKHSRKNFVYSTYKISRTSSINKYRYYTLVS